MQECMKTHNPHRCDRLVDHFGVLADATRLIVHLEAGAGRVCDVVTATRVAQTSVAKHLGRLSAAGPVCCERSGSEAWCPVADATRFELGGLSADRSRIDCAPSSRSSPRPPAVPDPEKI